MAQEGQSDSPMLLLESLAKCIGIKVALGSILEWEPQILAVQVWKDPDLDISENQFFHLPPSVLLINDQWLLFKSDFLSVACHDTNWPQTSLSSKWILPTSITWVPKDAKVYILSYLKLFDLTKWQLFKKEANFEKFPFLAKFKSFPVCMG